MVRPFPNYFFHNLAGNWKSGTANVLPAVLTTWSNLLALKGNKTSYELYHEQAREYINTAEKNAELIKRQGDIALRNLVYKDKLERGADVVRVGAAQGNLTGSNLDVLVKKEKIRRTDEQTLKANYLNKAMMELQEGYDQAYMAYGNLRAKANSDKYAGWASIIKGLEVYTQLSVRDAAVEAAVDTKRENIESQKEITEMHQDYYYRRPVGERVLSPEESASSIGLIENNRVISSTDISANNSAGEFDEITFL